MEQLSHNRTLIHTQYCVHLHEGQWSENLAEKIFNCLNKYWNIGKSDSVERFWQNLSTYETINWSNSLRENLMWCTHSHEFIISALTATDTEKNVSVNFTLRHHFMNQLREIPLIYRFDVISFSLHNNDNNAKGTNYSQYRTPDFPLQQQPIPNEPIIVHKRRLLDKIKCFLSIYRFIDYVELP